MTRKTVHLECRLPDYARIAEWLGFTKSRGTNVWKRPEIVRLYSEADLRDFIDSPDGAFAILAKMRGEGEGVRRRFAEIMEDTLPRFEPTDRYDTWGGLQFDELTPALIAEAALEAING